MPNKSAMSEFGVWLNNKLFPGLPSHYPLRKKILIARASSTGGVIWDMLQILFALLSCIFYVVSTFPLTLPETQSYYLLEVIMSQFFLAELLLGFYLANSLAFFIDFVTVIDVLSIMPVLIDFLVGESLDGGAYSFLQCFRVLRLIRIFKSFKLMRSTSGVKRQVIYLTVTLTSVIFLAAGVVQIIENEEQIGRCRYINALTAWAPSCSATAPADINCDCRENNCRSDYRPENVENKPTGIICTKLTFFDSFYYIIVTVSTVGYGDIRPGNFLSKMFIVIFIMGCLIVIPMSVSKLQLLLSLKSPFRRPFTRGAADDAHIIVCGHVNSADKLNTFFGEFFHEDRVTDQDYHAVVLSPHEPSEEVQMLLQGQRLGSRVTYVIGTAMATEDLKRAKADCAKCMFFLCNTDAKSGSVTDEDAATILRALSVSNFNPDLECLVQVLRPEERVILKDSDVDCILCLDEFKTAVQARNAVCPGFSTFIENIFHSVEGVDEDSQLAKTMAPWYREYLHGAGMELYFVEIDHVFIRNCRYEFSRIAECIFAEFGVIALGAANKARDSVVFNPRVKELHNFSNMKDFFHTYSTLLIMADDQAQADAIMKACADTEMMRNAQLRLLVEEENWPVHHSSRTSRVASEDGEETGSDDENEKYIGFAAYSSKAGAKDAASLPAVKTFAGQLPTTIKGPSFSKVPKVVKGTALKKLRLLPDIKVIKTAQSQRERLQPGFKAAGEVGQMSMIIEDASHLENHVVVFGCDTYLNMFISELRRPAVVGESYHPIVIVSEMEPAEWDFVASTYNDVYYISAKMDRVTITSKVNINNAFSVIILAGRDENVARDEDAVALFGFLKLEQLIPQHVFVSIELNSAGNMAVLNATIIKRERRLALEKKIGACRAKFRAESSKRFAESQRGPQTSTKKSEVSAAAQRASRSERRGSVLNPARTFSSRGTSQMHIKNDSSTDKEEKALEAKSALEQSNEKALWEAIDTHYVYPVYACAKVFVPSSFETLLVQSFFVKLTPVICERFVCGQLSQTVQQVSMPKSLVGRSFLDLFRLFASCGAVVLALYRAPHSDEGSLLSFVFTSPPPETILRECDKIFVFAALSSIEEATAKAMRATHQVQTMGLFGGADSD